MHSLVKFRYMFKNVLVLTTLFLSFIIQSYAQKSNDIMIGQWRSHLNYTLGKKCEEVNNRIYCITEYGLFYVNKEDLSIVALSKVNGFSDTRPTAIRYDSDNKVLLIAYKNTKIDVLKDNTIFTIDDIYRKYIPGKKAINDIYYHNNMAYISCSFGIVVYNIIKNEIKESYIFGDQVEVYSVTTNNGYIYASTPSGVLSASLSEPNLINESAWSYIKTGNCTNVVTFNNYIYVSINNNIERFDGTNWEMYLDTVSSTLNDLQVYNDHLIMVYGIVYTLDKNNNSRIYDDISNNSSTIMDSEGNFWGAVSPFSLIKYNVDNSGIVTRLYFIFPNGPKSHLNWDIEIKDDNVWVAPGSISFQWGLTYNFGGVYIFEDDLWENIDGGNKPKFGLLGDVVSIAFNPIDNHVFIGTFGWGLAEYYNNDIQTIYSIHNSTLRSNPNSPDSSIVQIVDLAFDKSGNLWVTNWAAVNQLSVRRKDGTWESFNLGSGSNRNVGQLVIDDNNQKWIILPNDGGILVFDENLSTNKKYKKLTSAEGNGNMPTNEVYSIAIDKENRIWIGTAEGVAVFYDPSLVFSNYNFDAQRIWIDNGNESGYLLSTELITSITVDGANNKWIGTKKGAWYVSEDGTEIIHHFNVDNSPLPSNYILDIAVNDNSGEVFFATDFGMVSYRGKATAGGQEHGKVYAFPNPVKPGYTGPIAIKGLVQDANVKITDIAGNIVFEITAEGGQAVWDGKNFSGKSVRSGVYLIFSTNEDGSETHITKLLIVR